MNIQDRAGVVAGALQGYAARGVFRGFSGRPDRRSRPVFRFTWLTRRPMTVAYDPVLRRLSFPDLLPAIDRYSGLADALKTIVRDHQRQRVPAHRRIDPRRARVGCTIRGGRFSLAVRVHGPHDEYAVQRSLNLVNELFLLLHARYPEYLVEWFGLPPE